MLPINEIYFGDCLDWLPLIDNNSIDLTVTSPPYDNLRTYKEECDFKFEPIAQELYRITKIGGVIVWIVGDATIKGSETGTSFKQALYFKEIGFNLHDTMIWIKNQMAFPAKNKYYNAFEYMFIFSKSKPKTFNPIKDKINISAGRKWTGPQRKKNGITIKHHNEKYICPEYGIRWNWWLIYNQSRGLHSKHPATFPTQLAYDHIISWSNKTDLILDPMCGSGTTCKMAQKANRNYIGIEMVEEYYNIAIERLKQ